MSIKKLEIQTKSDNQSKKSLLARMNIPSNETFTAEESNEMISKTNELVDKTNELEEKYEGYKPIQAFNFKGNKATYAELASIVNPQKDDAYGVIADGLVYIYNGISFPASGQGLNLGLNPSGIVAEGIKEAVSGDEVYKTLNLTLKNLSKNGDFSNGLIDYTTGIDLVDITVENGICKFTGKGGVSSVGVRISQTSLPTTNDIVFIAVVARRLNDVGSSNNLYIGRGTTTSGEQFRITTEFQSYCMTSNVASSILKFSGGINAKIEVKNVMAFNLTEIFGAGKEPVAEEFQMLLNANLEHIHSKDVDVIDLALKSSRKADLGYRVGEKIKTLKEVEYLSNLTLTNLNPNGNFVNSTSGFSVGSNITDYNYSNHIMSFAGAGEPISNETQVYKQINNFPSESKMFMSVVARSNNNARLMFSRGVNYPLQQEKLTNLFQRFSGVFDNSSTRIKLGANLGGNVEIESVTIIDLTEIFGAGKEPSAEYLNEILNITGYFENNIIVENNNLKIASELVVKKVKNEIRPKLKVLVVSSSHGIDTVLHFPVLAHYGGIDIVCGSIYSAGNDIVAVADKIKNNSDFSLLGIHNGLGQWNLQNVGVSGGRTLKKALDLHDWDVIMVQRSANQSTGWTQEQKEAMSFVTDYIRQNTFNNPEILFNSGLSYPVDTNANYTRQDQINRTNLINQTAQIVQKDFFFDVMPVCTAIQNARNTFLKNYGTWIDKDLARDSIHLDTGIGAYITGCVMFEKIIGKRFNKSIRNMNHIPTRTSVSGLITTSNYFTNITEEMAKTAKLCALAAVMNPFDISESLINNFAELN